VKRETSTARFVIKTLVLGPTLWLQSYSTESNHYRSIMAKIICISAVILIILALNIQQVSSSGGADLLFFRPDSASTFLGDCKQQRHGSHKIDGVGELDFSEDYQELARGKTGD
jgi:hypothetical protein